MTLLLTLNLQGQISLQDDTIMINLVEIKGRQSWKEFYGYKTMKFDSVILNGYQQQTIADLISDNTGIYIKTYGPGGLSTSSFRGTGAGHSQIAWNNINLNNPMVGQSDLSLIPAGFVDDVNVFYGGGSMNIGSGGLGGIIELTTQPEWNKKNLVFINPGMGSFGRYSGLIKIRASGKDLQTVTKVYLNTAENDFPYLNTVSGSDNEWELRKNSQVEQKGFIQELYLRKLKSSLSARLWYQTASRNLPSPIISSEMNPPENQKDESLRSMFSYSTPAGGSLINLTAAYVYDKLLYNNELSSINSSNYSQRFIINSDFETRINEIADLKFSIGDELNYVRTNNYEEDKIRNIATVTAAAAADFTEWISTRVLVREILQDENLLTPDFSAGVELKPFNEKSYFIKANFSRNTRIATLNDMYWAPGGNPDLKNETGYQYEITFLMTNSITSCFKIENDLTVFRNDFRDMIQWHPGETSYWVADNINNMTTSGLEADIDINYSVNRFRGSLHASYTLTSASDKDQSIINTLRSGNQLVYVPVHQFGSILSVSWSNFHSSVNADYTGKRYLDQENSSYLPSYFITDVNVGSLFTSGRNSFDISFLIYNLFDISYQNVAYFPMPGRNYMFSVIYQFKN